MFAARSTALTRGDFFRSFLPGVALVRLIRVRRLLLERVETRAEVTGAQFADGARASPLKRAQDLSKALLRLCRVGVHGWGSVRRGTRLRSGETPKTGFFDEQNI